MGTLQAIYGEDFKLLPQEPSVSYSISVATPDNTHSLEVQVSYQEATASLVGLLLSVRHHMRPDNLP